MTVTVTEGRRETVSYIDACEFLKKGGLTLMDMQRVLALQGLGSYVYDDPGFASNQSGVCSLQSSGAGEGSTCSTGCFDDAQMDW